MIFGDFFLQLGPLFIFLFFLGGAQPQISPVNFFKSHFYNAEKAEFFNYELHCLIERSRILQKNEPLFKLKLREKQHRDSTIVFAENKNSMRERNKLCSQYTQRPNLLVYFEKILSLKKNSTNIVVVR